jgi:hypothetical protein
VLQICSHSPVHVNIMSSYCSAAMIGRPSYREHKDDIPGPHDTRAAFEALEKHRPAISLAGRPRSPKVRHKCDAKVMMGYRSPTCRNPPTSRSASTTLGLFF